MPRGVVVVQPLHVAGERAAGVAGVAAAVAERRRASKRIRRSSTRRLTSTWAGAYAGALTVFTACGPVCVKLTWRACGRDPDVGKKEKMDAAMDDYWGKEEEGK